MTMPMVTLRNGIKIANFSSPHPFNFVDGSVLPACEPDRVKDGALEVFEDEIPGIKGTTDIKIHFDLTAKVVSMLVEANESEADVVLIPFPVLGAIKETNPELLGKCRVIRVADRQTKAIHIDKFCI